MFLLGFAFGAVTTYLALHFIKRFFTKFKIVDRKEHSDETA